MRTTKQWMAETMQPIIDRIAGDQTPAKAKPDALSLLHPSLGLAFTAEFKPKPEVYRSNVRAFDTMVNCLHFLRGDKAKDNLPSGCDGCRVDLAGEMVCECHFVKKVMP